MHHVSPKSALALAALLAAACQDPSAPRTDASSPAPGDTPSLAKDGEPGQPIPGEYIVVFDDGVADPEAKAKDKEKAFRSGKKLKQVYKHALKGFAAELSAEDVAALRADPEVAYVEPDQMMTTDATQSGATWGIDRTDQRSRPLSGTYTYATTASNVRVYIIDSGINTGHADFGGRASNVYDATGGNGADCNGHGTHVAGTVGGARWGVAKGALLRGVRVFTCSGSSANSIILAGIDWVFMVPGARVVVGEVELELTSYAHPCRNISDSFRGGRFGRISAKTHADEARVYARVVVEGTVRPGDPVRVTGGALAAD